MPITSLTLHILLVLAGGDHDAPAIIEGIARDSQGTQLSSESATYKALKRLQNEGYVRPSPAGRKVYTLTPKGRQALQSEHNRYARVASLLHERLS